MIWNVFLLCFCLRLTCTVLLCWSLYTKAPALKKVPFPAPEPPSIRSNIGFSFPIAVIARMFCQCRAVTPNYAMNTMSISDTFDTFDTFQHPLQLVNPLQRCTIMHGLIPFDPSPAQSWLSSVPQSDQHF